MLLKKISEAEIRNRIRDLERELHEAKRSLNLIGVDDDKNGTSPYALATAPLISKRGYLFKWADRSIGWGGTKWALRFVVLEGGKISYFRDHSDISPRYVLTLRGCAVRDEGLKPNKRYKNYKKGVDLPIDEPGAYFHVFSIYQRVDSYDDRDTSETDDSPSEVVPLLRFSTPSLAEKTQWIKLISEACEYCDTEEFIAAEMAASVEAEKRKLQEQEMRLAMPEATKGTLPPLYFAPPVPAPMKRVPSGFNVKRPRLYRTTSGNLDADKVESRSTKGYPPSKPMHRAAAPSFLSNEGPPRSYRGFFNLAIILLVLSNFRLLIDTIKSEGFILAQLSHIPRLARDPWDDSPLFSGFLLFQVFILMTYLVERLLSKRKLGERFGMLLHYTIAHSCLFVSIAVVWNFVDNPAIGGTLMLHACITWMKLLSYVHANQDYRLSAGDIDTYKATLALLEDLDEGDAKTVYPKYVVCLAVLSLWFATAVS